MIDFFCRAKSEVQTRIILREVAAAAVDLIRLCDTSCYHFYSGTNRHAIAFGARQIEADPIAAWYSVVFQDHRSAVEIPDDHVHIAIVEEIAYRQTS